MFSFKLAGAIAAILAFSPVGARADLALQATLNNSSEIPATLPTTSFGDPRPASFGTALFLYDWTLPVLSVSLTMTVFNIDVTRSQTADSNDDLITVQLHIGPDVTSTTNGPVAFNLFGPSNDLRPRAAAIMPFATTVGGTITATWDVPFGPAENNWLFHLISGRAYIDVHTAQFQEARFVET
jgi:hypothetical protein